MGMRYTFTRSNRSILMPHRLISLLLIPFLLASFLVTAVALSALSHQLLAAEARLAQTLLISKHADAANYFAQNDWVALSAILENLSDSLENSRAVVTDTRGAVILVNGEPQDTGQSFTSVLVFEGQTLGTLTLTTDHRAMDSQLIQTGFFILLMTFILTVVMTLFVVQFGDFVRIWIGLDPPRRHQGPTPTGAVQRNQSGHLKLFFAIKLAPARLAPINDLRSLALQFKGQLSTAAEGDYEVRFEETDAVAQGFDFYSGLRKLLAPIDAFEARLALGIDKTTVEGETLKRTKFLASLSDGDLVIDEKTRRLLTEALQDGYQLVPFSSPLASDLNLSSLTLDP